MLRSWAVASRSLRSHALREARWSAVRGGRVGEGQGVPVDRRLLASSVARRRTAGVMRRRDGAVKSETGAFRESAAAHGDDVAKDLPEGSAAAADSGDGAAKTITAESVALAVKESKEMTVTERQALVLSPPALVVTREYEWGNILIGFEQANRYTIRAAPRGEVVGYIAEEDSLGRSLARNLLRTHRSFKATILDSAGEPFFVLRRPFYMFSTSMYVETPDGRTMGEIHMEWHLWRRRYNLYTDKTQFARVDQGFLAVDFDMRDEQDRKMASVNKDFTGLAREIFTDARQYVIRLQADYSGEDLTPDGISREHLRNDASEVLSDSKLTLDQKATILACAVSIDFDYFSLHSHGGGVLGPGMPIMAPIPVPGGGTADVPVGGPAGGPEAVPDPASSEAGGAAGIGAGSFGTQGGAFGAPGGAVDPPPGDAQWGQFEEAQPDFYEPDFSQPDFDDQGGGDSDGGFSVADVISTIFGDGDD